MWLLDGTKGHRCFSLFVFWQQPKSSLPKFFFLSLFSLKVLISSAVPASSRFDVRAVSPDKMRAEPLVLGVTVWETWNEPSAKNIFWVSKAFIYRFISSSCLVFWVGDVNRRRSYPSNVSAYDSETVLEVFLRHFSRIYAAKNTPEETVTTGKHWAS